MYYDEIFNENEIYGNAATIGYKESNGNSKSKTRYLKVKKNVNREWTDGKYYGKVFVEQHGSIKYIRKATTGDIVDKAFQVGSGVEDLFFVVNDSTGRNKGKEPMRLFYDSPEQFENHQFCILSSEVKHKWHLKNMIARQRYKHILA